MSDPLERERAAAQAQIEALTGELDAVMAASTSVRRRRACSSSAAICCRSKAMVAPSGSCSSSALVSFDASTKPR